MQSPSGSGRCACAGVALMALAACSGHHDAGRDANATEAGIDAADIDAEPLDGGDFVPGVCNVMGTGASTTQTVGSAGGTVTLEGATVVIPPGALSDDWPITITSSTECPPDDLDVLSPMYVFEPEGLTFDLPVEVTIHYDGEPQAALLRWTAPAIGWETPGFVGEGNAVSGMVTHFSEGYASEPARLAGNPDIWFTAHPDTLDPGELTLLAFWLPAGPTFSCSIDQGVGYVTPSPAWFVGGRAVHLQYGDFSVRTGGTTTYTVTCTGPVTVTASVTVTVRSSRVLSLTATPNMRVAPGSRVTVSWSGGNDLTDCQLTTVALRTLDHESVGPRGDRSANPEVPTTYWLDCWNSRRQQLTRRAFVDVCAMLGQSCQSMESYPRCCPGLAMSTGNECGGSPRRCCRPTGGACARTADCCDGLCTSGHCVAPADGGVLDAGGADAGVDAGGCAPPAIDCGGVCRNLSTDGESCGGCFHSCSAVQTCRGGQCCPMGGTNCPLGCFDLQDDNGNCGACGHACGSGTFCYLGACTNLSGTCDPAVPGACTPAGLSCRSQGISDARLGRHTCQYEAGGPCRDPAVYYDCAGDLQCVGGSCVCEPSGEPCVLQLDCCAGLVCHNAGYASPVCSACFASGMPCRNPTPGRMEEQDCCGPLTCTSGTCR